jgi:subtilisin family serine protease
VAEHPIHRNGLQRRIADQVDYIKKEFAKAKKPVDYVPTDRGGVGYMYATDHILVWRQYLAEVLAILELDREPERDRPGRAAVVAEGGGLSHVVGDVYKLPLNGRDVPDTLREIDAILGPGIAATPDHVLTVAGGEANGCPATEPEEVYDEIEPFPSVCRGTGGAGVLIYLADTGLLADAHTHPWLAGVQAGDIDPQPHPPTIPHYTGHGTFVAGVARCMAPAAELIVTNTFAIAGSALESDTGQRLAAALGLGVDIFHLTISAPSRLDLPMIGIAEFLRLMRQYKGTICVVAAGNWGSRRPSWPAAFPEVISVGALGADWRGRATFSNFGSWVDVYAPGRDLINAYATGTYTCDVYPYAGNPREFYGMCKWSGTSFSTPIVTGLIAARMSDAGETAAQAAQAVLARAHRQAIPGTGPVLLPCCGDDTRCRCGGGERCRCADRQGCRAC